MKSDLSPEAISLGLDTRLVGRRVLYLVTVSSTMDAARREAEGGAPEGTVVVAESQTAGRGRFLRPWVSPPGVNLYLSLLLRPRPDELARLNMATTLAVARAIGTVTGLQAAIKWPNDLHLSGRKVCGILIEGHVDAHAAPYAVLGIGLNVNFDLAPYPEIGALATSLAQETGGSVSRLAVLHALLREMDGLYAALQRGDSSWEEWRSLVETLGRQVRVQWQGVVEEGLATEVDREGSLVLERADGSRVTLPAGEVTLRVG